MTKARVKGWELSLPAMRPRPWYSLVILLLTDRLSTPWPRSVCPARRAACRRGRSIDWGSPLSSGAVHFAAVSSLVE